MKHLDQTELMMLHYDPEGSSAAEQHVDECDRCRTAYDTLSRALAADAKNRHDITAGYPDSFWERQRTAILRRSIAEKERRRAQSILWSGFAAAMFLAVVALFLTRNFNHAPAVEAHPSATVVSKTPPASAPAPSTPDRVATLDEVPTDPWDSDELQSFHDVVKWESWEETRQPSRKGGSS